MDTDAKPSVFLAKSLDHNKCQIDYRVFLHGKVVGRRSVNLLKLNKIDFFRERVGLVFHKEQCCTAWPHTLASHSIKAEYQSQLPMRFVYKLNAPLSLSGLLITILSKLTQDSNHAHQPLSAQRSSHPT